MGEPNVYSESVADEEKGRECAHHHVLGIGIVFLGLAAIVQLISGILTALAHDWMRVCLFLFGSFIAIVCSCFAILHEAMNTLSTRLGARLFSIQATIRVKVPLSLVVADVAACISVPLLLLLAIFAGLRMQWLAFGLCLWGCGVVVVVPLVIRALLRIRAWSKCLMLSGDRDHENTRDRLD